MVSSSLNRADEYLSRVVEWARREDDVRALILVGSRAGREPADDLADIDVSVFAKTSEPYTRNSEWLSAIGDVWVCVPDKFARGGEVIPTRLVIFDGGVKVDFAFYGLHVLDELAGSDELDVGYRVLLDKDGATSRLKPPSFSARKHDAPTEAEFVSLCEEFWFEAYHVAKYLKRGDLWAAKFRDWSTKEMLLRMIELSERSRRGWDYDTGHMGKRMKSWAQANTWESLHRAFSRFDAEDGWRGLAATTELFSRLSKETADRLGFAYPDDAGRNITAFISQLRGS